MFTQRDRSRAHVHHRLTDELEEGSLVGGGNNSVHVHTRSHSHHVHPSRTFPDPNQFTNVQQSGSSLENVAPSNHNQQSGSSRENVAPSHHNQQRGSSRENVAPPNSNQSDPDFNRGSFANRNVNNRTLYQPGDNMHPPVQLRILGRGESLPSSLTASSLMNSGNSNNTILNATPQYQNVANNNSNMTTQQNINNRNNVINNPANRNYNPLADTSGFRRFDSPGTSSHSDSSRSESSSTHSSSSHGSSSGSYSTDTNTTIDSRSTDSTYTPSLPSPRMPGHPATRSQGLPNSMFVLPNLTHPAQRPQPPPVSQSQQGVQRLSMPYAYGTGANAQPIGDSSNAMSTGTYGRNERGYLQKLMVRIKLTELIGAVGKFESQGDKRTDPIKWLKELRLTLPGYAIDEIEYGVVIGQLMADTSQKEWCTNNLAYKPWDEVITLFCEHFQGAAALQKLRQEYTALHQHANEEVFRFTTRAKDIIDSVCYNANDRTVLEHVLLSMRAPIQTEMARTWSNNNQHLSLHDQRYHTWDELVTAASRAEAMISATFQQRRDVVTTSSRSGSRDNSASSRDRSKDRSSRDRYQSQNKSRTSSRSFNFKSRDRRSNRSNSRPARAAMPFNKPSTGKVMSANDAKKTDPRFLSKKMRPDTKFKVKCHRCGRDNHKADGCYASKHINGTVLAAIATVQHSSTEKEKNENNKDDMDESEHDSEDYDEELDDDYEDDTDIKVKEDNNDNSGDDNDDDENDDDLHHGSKRH